MPRTTNLLGALRRVLGAADAANELHWLRQYASKSKVSLRTLVARRVAHEPLQYILGTQPFGALDLKVRPPVLIPRPETEYWAQRLVDVRRPASDAQRVEVLDVCTGSGCIPALLAHEWPRDAVRVLAVDVADEAVALARKNTAATRGVVRVLQADIFSSDFEGLVGAWGPHGVDIITANPPYVSDAEYAALDRSVRDFEDSRALLGGPDGLKFYPRIATLASNLVRSGGLVAVEVGKGQSSAVENIFRALPAVSRTEIWDDPWGIPRTVLAHIR